MAADSKITIDLELRKDQAEARLRQFEQRAAQQLERLQAVQARYEANPTAFVRNQLMASRLAYSRRLGDVQTTGAQVRGLQMKIDEESARKGGRLFGMAVNKQTELFVRQFVGAYVAREAMDIGFAAMYTAGGNNAGIRKAQGMASGATTGAQVGAAFGPFGLAIGTAVGALAGFTSALIKESKEIDAERANRANAFSMQRFEVGRGIQNYAFDRAVAMHARPAQIAMLQQRITEIESGNGQFSIKSLSERLRAMGDDHESIAYRDVEQMLQRSMQERGQLQQRLFQTATQPYYRFQDAGRFADSRAKQGLYSGVAGQSYMIDSPMAKVQNALARAGVDPTSLQGEQLQRWIDWAGGMARKGKGEKGRAQFEASLERTTGAKVDLGGIDFAAQRKIPIAGIDFKELNNPVVNELKNIRRKLEAIANTADKNANDRETGAKWTRTHIAFGFGT
jgi:hypothetical protein